MFNVVYDVLMDLLDIVGVLFKVLLLNGLFGFGFGLCGLGWVLVYFELDMLVINLIKMCGVGMLVYEWFHVFDNYFQW